MAAAEEFPAVRTWSLADEAATRRFGAVLAGVLRPGDVVGLSGTLGAGKTTLARAMVEALDERFGIRSGDVPSPTFTLVQLYEFPTFTLYHFDLYRIEDPMELFELGIEEALAGGVSLVEWPEKAGSLLPPGRLDVELAQGEDAGARIATVTMRDGWSPRLRGASLHG